MTLTFGSLFSGIGGMDLGLERAGWKCVWQCEIDPYATRVLEKHWPHVRRWDDVRTFPPAGEWGCDLIAGGFPCQDISEAGKRVGIDGKRSGLWAEYLRVIRVVRPRFVIVENVSAILVRGMGRVLGELAECGYDAEWDCLPAGVFGAWHFRERIFVVAYPTSGGHPRHGGKGKDCRQSSCPGERGELFRFACNDGSSKLLVGRPRRGTWGFEPGVGRVADGVPSRVDRLRGIGNAVVPQVAEWIGHRLKGLATAHA